MKSHLAIIAALVLGGCASTQTPPIEAHVSGPRFPASQFECGEKPVPPAPAGATGKTAAKFETRLGAWGQGCSDRLQSTGRQLDAAGQIVR